jgi:hypothetical protein
MRVSPDAGDAGESVGSVGVTDVVEATETGVVVVPCERVGDAGPFCATATWTTKTAGKIKNLNCIGLKIN